MTSDIYLLVTLNSSDAGDGIIRILRVNTMPADAPKVARASAGMALAVWDRHNVLLFQSQCHLFGSSQIKDTIQNVDISFMIFKTIQHVKRVNMWFNMLIIYWNISHVTWLDCWDGIGLITATSIQCWTSFGPFMILIQGRGEIVWSRMKFDGIV